MSGRSVLYCGRDSRNTIRPTSDTRRRPPGRFQSSFSPNPESPELRALRPGDEGRETTTLLMFVDNLTTDPVYYFTVVFCVTLSIVLHELGHGIAAIAQGDDTPRVTGHMTLNPLVHMGTMGLGLLCFAGIAFGVMPVDPRRFRGRHGDAFVAAAGPLVNGVIAIFSLTILAMLIEQGIPFGSSGQRRQYSAIRS